MPLAVGLDQLDAVAAAVGVVPGVQAEDDQVGVGGVEEAGDVLLAVDMGVGVRVDDDVAARSGPAPRGPAAPSGGQIAPLLGGERAVLQHLAGLVVAPEGRG